MKKQPEQIIKNQIMDHLKMNYVGKIFFWPQATVGIFDSKRKIYRKNKSRHGINGISDILCICSPNGRFLAIEVKSKTGKASSEQLAFLEYVRCHGGLGIIARSVEDVEEGLRSSGLFTDRPKETPFIY